MPPFAAQHALFRAYDIRGARQYFTVAFIQTLGHAFAKLYNLKNHPINNNTAHNNELAPSIKPTNKHLANTVIIGYDARFSSDTIAKVLADVLRQHNLIVIDLGLITTPMMAFWAKQYNGHGIIVTASHSAKDTLGIKWLVNNTSPSSAAIQALYQQLHIDNLQSHSNTLDQSHSKTLEHYNAKNQPSNPADIAHNNSSDVSLPADQIATTYINAIVQVFSRIYQHHDKTTVNNRMGLSTLNLTIVIDCMNGATSNIAQPLFERFCQQVIMLNDTPDGNFPNGNPDPTEANRLAELQQTVIIHEADIGLAFDGDGDRLMIVDNSGKVVMPDHLLYLLAQVALTERPKPLTGAVLAAQVLFDIKCSHHLPKLLSQLGATPVMSRTGSSLMRQQLQSGESRIIFAGELSGHFIFNDDYFIIYDDAMYAGLRLLHWLVHTASTLNIAAVLNTTHAKIHTDSWGEPRPSLAPYKLTDITQSLPVMVSTADHYLPLPATLPADCSIVQQVATFCHYLQHLVEAKPASCSSKNKPATSCASSLCTCFAKRQQITLAQAKQLLPLGTRLTCIDGVRLDFAHGFGVLRQSNTSHSLTVRFAGDSKADIKDVQTRFAALCRPFNKNLAEQIEAFYPE